MVAERGFLMWEAEMTVFGQDADGSER